MDRVQMTVNEIEYMTKIVDEEVGRKDRNCQSRGNRRKDISEKRTHRFVPQKKT